MGAGPCEALGVLSKNNPMNDCKEEGRARCYVIVSAASNEDGRVRFYRERRKGIRPRPRALLYVVPKGSASARWPVFGLPCGHFLEAPIRQNIG